MTEAKREQEILECLRANLKKAMADKDINSFQIMKMTGLSQSAAYDVFNEKIHKIPTVMTLDRMGEVLDLSLSEMFRDCHKPDMTLRDQKIEELRIILEHAPDEILDRELAYLKALRNKKV